MGVFDKKTGSHKITVPAGRRSCLDENKRAVMGMDETLNIHSIESFSTLDGPGIRYVIFLQGCDIHCRYCHNPDTWNPNDGNRIEITDILWEIEKNRAYLKPNHGGVTAGGGEPLVQARPLTHLFAKIQSGELTTCLDTSGLMMNSDIRELLNHTSLVLLDIKHPDPESHRALTGHDNAAVFAFQDYLDEKGIAYWARFPLLPGINDSLKTLDRLKARLKNRPALKQVEVLPYHTLGVYKWEALKMTYDLKDQKPVSTEKAAEVQAYLTA